MRAWGILLLIVLFVGCLDNDSVDKELEVELNNYFLSEMGVELLPTYTVLRIEEDTAYVTANMNVEGDATSWKTQLNMMLTLIFISILDTHPEVTYIDITVGDPSWADLSMIVDRNEYNKFIEENPVTLPKAENEETSESFDDETHSESSTNDSIPEEIIENSPLRLIRILPNTGVKLHEIILSGEGTEDNRIKVDDDLIIQINGEDFFVNNDSVAEKIPSVKLKLENGSVISVIAINKHKGYKGLLPLYLENKFGQKVKLTDGFPMVESGYRDEGVFFNESFIVSYSSKTFIEEP